MSEEVPESIERIRKIQTEFAAKGDALGWFDALYKESDGDNTKIHWADLETNKYFREWAEANDLKGKGRTALVVGCGLGDDAVYLDELGFKVTAFDISPTAIEWAKRLHGDKDIRFEVADLFNTPAEWRLRFDFVLEIYTIQPLPIEMRPDVIDAIAGFVGEKGELVVVTRGRDDDEPVEHVPWPLSNKDLSRFEINGLKRQDTMIFPPENEGESGRWAILYKR